MKRDPTICVKRSDLARILEELADKWGFDSSSAKEKADELVTKAAPYAAVRRSVITGVQKKHYAKTQAATAVSDGHVKVFNRLLHGERVKRRHKTIKSITPKSKAYTHIMQAADAALEFAKEYYGTDDKSIAEGMQAYVKTAFDMIRGKYYPNKLVTLKERVFDYAEAQRVVDNNAEPVLTKQLHDYYALMAEDGSGVYKTFTETLDYQHFVVTAHYVKQYSAEPVQWLEAQFAGLAFLESFPRPVQLYGDSAVERYQKYMYAVKGSSKKPTTELTERERQYFAMLAKNTKH